MLCVLILKMSSRNLQSQADSEQQILGNFSWQFNLPAYRLWWSHRRNKSNSILLRFHLLETFNIWSRRIINILYFSFNFVCHCSYLYLNNNNCFSILFLCLYPFAYTIRIICNYATDFWNGNLQTMICSLQTQRFFTQDWLNLT